MAILTNIDWQYNVRAKRGERRGDNGRFVKCISFVNSTMDDAESETKSTIEALAGSGELVEIRHYDRAAFISDPFAAEPLTQMAGAR
jgi:hypothetical protein